MKIWPKKVTDIYKYLIYKRIFKISLSSEALEEQDMSFSNPPTPCLAWTIPVRALGPSSTYLYNKHTLIGQVSKLTEIKNPATSPSF
jgi:hypothetical protein